MISQMKVNPRSAKQRVTTNKRCMELCFRVESNRCIMFYLRKVGFVQDFGVGGWVLQLLRVRWAKLRLQGWKLLIFVCATVAEQRWKF